MTTTTTEPEELDYFKLKLIDYLRCSFPERLSDKEFIDARSDMAADTYVNAVRDGYNHMEAGSLSNEVLYAGLYFSKYETIRNVLWNNFAREVSEKDAEGLAIKLLPVCEKYFAKYSINDEFDSTPEFDELCDKLTVFLKKWIAKNVLQ